MLVSCLIMAFSLAAISCTNGSDDRRILLSDPQYIQQELTRFQSELQGMQVKYNELSTKYNTQNTNLTDLQTKYNTLKLNKVQGDKGPVLTRWGRSDCPANITTMVYSGTAGGSYHTHTGAAAEYICMPNDPIWGPHKDLVYGERVGYIYGAEYEEPKDLFGMPNLAEDVPCAVCLGTHHITSVMIPGRTLCYPGWTEVYHGDLASGYYGHQAASQYVCVDGNTQAIAKGGSNDDGGKLFYGVKAKCGALPCPPYEEGKFLSCVVCMK